MCNPVLLVMYRVFSFRSHLSDSVQSKEDDSDQQVDFLVLKIKIFNVHRLVRVWRFVSENNRVAYAPAKYVLCTGTLEWDPSPASIACSTCDLKYVRDEVCDRDNNDEFCGFDGGDCCLSTLSEYFNGPIETYPELCGEDCLCKDPNAPENRDPGHRHEYRTSRGESHRYMNALKYRLQQQRPHRVDKRQRHSRPRQWDKCDRVLSILIMDFVICITK